MKPEKKYQINFSIWYHGFEKFLETFLTFLITRL